MSIRSASWTVRFGQPATRVWAALADTARFNEAANLPRQRIVETPQPDGSVVYSGSARMGPFALSWREEPVEWVTPSRFRHVRRFANGPFRSLAATLTLSPEGEGCRGDYVLEVEPRGLLGHAALAAGFFRSFGRTFARLSAEAAGYAAGESERPFASHQGGVAPDGEARLAAGLRRLVEAGVDADLAARLGDLIRDGAEVDLLHIRPLRLARSWKVPERDAIELCLWATKLGILEMRWDLLCPNCRGPKLQVASLDRLPRGAHCPTCNIDYERDFARNVELSFRPLAAVRAIESGEFCLFGPMTTPHVVVQQTLAPGEEREIAADLPSGDYRLRGLHPLGECLVSWTGGGFPELIASERGIAAGAPARPGTVCLVNRLGRSVSVVIESREWVKDALLAHRVTTLQAFRDLFSAEVLRPGDDVGVAHVSLMFTDLRGSTALYERVGDAAAYRLVREHFAFLAASVRRHDGAIVKTIGDAVMAVFAEPADALAAALDVQRSVAAFNGAHAGGEAIVIKLGLHGGPCIAVNLNERLDYFGSVVNLAARLQGESRGGDVVLSSAFAADPRVAPAVAGLAHTDEAAALKGLAQPVTFVRIVPTVRPDA